MKDKIYHITAKHPKTEEIMDLYFPSINAAKRANHGLIDFRNHGLKNGSLFKKIEEPEIEEQPLGWEDWKQ